LAEVCKKVIERGGTEKINLIAVAICESVAVGIGTPLAPSGQSVAGSENSPLSSGHVPYKLAVGLQVAGKINNIRRINRNTCDRLRKCLHAIVVIIAVHRFGLGEYGRKRLRALDTQIRLHDFFHGIVLGDPRTLHHPAAGGEVEAQLDIDPLRLADREAEEIPPLGALIIHTKERRGTGIAASADQVDSGDSFGLELFEVAGDAGFVHPIVNPKPIHARFGGIGGRNEICIEVF